METTMLMKRKSSGRRKIEIKKIEKNSNLQVTFSKRRVGLFKKAAELSILCGIDIAVIVQSPAGNIFASGGQAPINSVIDGYLAATSAGSNISNQFQEVGGGGRGVQDDHQDAKKYVEIMKKIEDEKVKEKKLMERNSKDIDGKEFWWKQPFDDLGLDELEEYMAALKILKKNVSAKAEELARVNAVSSNLFIPNATFDYFGDFSSPS